MIEIREKVLIKLRDREEGDERVEWMLKEDG